MIRILFLFLLFLGLTTPRGEAQAFIKTADLFRRSTDNSHTGQLNILHDQSIDTLLSRYILISKFPDVKSYQLYAEPGYFKVRVGDFRTKTEATRLFLIISKEFPDAYLVPGIINFPDLNKK